jgi:hypothetical protein
VQLSSISQALQSQASSSSISTILITSASSVASSIRQESRIKIDSLSDTRFSLESKHRQNRYSDVRNQYDSESQFENRDDSNRYSNRYEARNVDVQRNRNENRSRTRNLSNYPNDEYPRSFESRYDNHEPNRTQIRQYDPESNNYASNFYSASESLSKKSYSKKLALLKKIYSYNDKFEATRDNFHFKLQIYINKCRRADISSHAYDKKANIMLKEEALTHYYANKFISFDDFCTRMRQFYEKSE